MDTLEINSNQSQDNFWIKVMRILNSNEMENQERKDSLSGPLRHVINKCEMMWIWSLLVNLMSLYCDNHARISISRTLIFHEVTKHVDMGRHIIEKLLDGAYHNSTHLHAATRKHNSKEYYNNRGMLNIYAPT